jgi:hypothetical protein
MDGDGMGCSRTESWNSVVIRRKVLLLCQTHY